MNAELIQRAAYTIESACQSLQPLFGQGYGSNIDRLIEALDNFKPIYPSPLRPIQFQQYNINPVTKQFIPPFQEETFTGLFHAFSTESDGPEHYPVAIVETSDGQIHTPLASKCKFLDKPVTPP